MKKYISIIRQLFLVSIARIVVYRMEFVSAVVSSFYWFILAITSISILTYQADTIGGWNRYELFIVQGVYSMIIGVYVGIFERNIATFMQEVWQGTYEYKLLKPVDSQFMASIGYFRPHALARFIAGVVLILYALAHLHITISFGTWIVFLSVFLCSIVVVYSVSMLLSLVCFWSPNLFNLSEAISNFISLSRYPLIILKSLLGVSVYILLPILVMTTVPAQVLLRTSERSLFTAAVLFAVVSFVTVRGLWESSVRKYEGVNS